MSFHETPYGDSTRRRNRVLVVLFVVGSWMACALGTALTEWPLRNAIGLGVVAAVFGAAFWFMFGAKRAGHVGLSPGTRQSLRRTFWQR